MIQNILRWEADLNCFLSYERATRQLEITFPDTTQDASLERPPAGSPRALSAPLKVFIGITRACDLECPFCFARGRRYGRPMSTTNIRSIIHQAADMGVLELRLTGGEPTVHPDFFRIIGWIEQLGMNCSINTHGVFSDRTLPLLTASKVDDIRISVDGPEDIHIDKALSVGTVRDMPLAKLWRLAIQDVEERLLPRFPGCASCYPQQRWPIWTNQIAAGSSRSRHLY